MFCQGQAYPTENKKEKAIFFWLFFIFLFPKTAKGVQKKPNWQLCCTRIENAHKVRKKTFIVYVLKSRKVFFFPAVTL